MIKRIDIGTDIATIGVWDPAHERHDLSKAGYSEFEVALQAEAEAGRLFFVNTGADGGYETDFYVDEAPDAERLGVYSAVEREFLITCESGRLIAGGIEDFSSAKKQVTSVEDQFEVVPGVYALRFYDVIEDKLAERLQSTVGLEDYAYYESKSGRPSWGCLLFVIASSVLFSRLWLVAGGLFAIWLIYVIIRFRAHTGDTRLREIARRIEAFHNQFPSCICVLRRVEEPGGIKGGWHDLGG